jgi:arylsulfatase A-like enzyme
MRDGIFEQRPDLAQLAAAAYDTEVAALDAYLSELAKDLPGFEKAIVVVTADHGEEFLEHGSMMHGNNLLQPQVHVPLLIRLPNGAHAGLRIAEPVSLVDVLPTLAALIGSPAPKSLDGVDLTPLWQGGRAPSRDVLLHLDVPWARHKALVRGSLKFVETEAGERSVFDVRRDPSEKTNLYRAKDETHLAVFQAIADQVQYNVRFRPRTIEAEIPDALRDKLRSLGYIN